MSEIIHSSSTQVEDRVAQPLLSSREPHNVNRRYDNCVYRYDKQAGLILIGVHV